MKHPTLDKLLTNISDRIVAHRVDMALKDLAFRTLSRMEEYAAHLIPSRSDRLKDRVYAFIEKYLPEGYMQLAYNRIQP